MSAQNLPWIVFGIVVVVMLTADLTLFHRRSKESSLKEALLWSLFWVALALGFNIAVYFWRGGATALEFLAGYLIEESLSVDNLFVFLMIFSYFRVPVKYQHKVLFWGIVGVLVMRGIFIFAGVELIRRFHWTIYIFGAFLILTGIKMAFQGKQEIQSEKNLVLRIFRKFVPVTKDFEGDRFFIRRAGRIFATPLFVVVLVIETTDLIFAVDSIPAVLAITQDPFVVFTSNIFAVLGLRAIFFALSGFMQLFHHLKYGLSVILTFVGVKMLVSQVYKMPIVVALGVIACILAASVATSVLWPPKEKGNSGA